MRLERRSCGQAQGLYRCEAVTGTRYEVVLPALPPPYMQIIFGAGGGLQSEISTIAVLALNPRAEIRCPQAHYLRISRKSQRAVLCDHCYLRLVACLLLNTNTFCGLRRRDK